MVANLSGVVVLSYGVKGCVAPGVGKSVWATGSPVSRRGELGETELPPAIKNADAK